MHIKTDPARRFVIRATWRSVELWITEPTAFDNRPAWQSRPDGPIALLRRALSDFEPKEEEALACAWAYTDEVKRLDVENRLEATLAATAKRKGISVEQAKAERIATVPAKRIGDPAEFGAACAFLCSAHAGYITGQNIVIDGGAFPGAF